MTDSDKRGPQGFAGTRGAPGQDGKRGDGGATGRRGQDGLRGPKGFTGIKGAEGQKGEPGKQGEEGEQGPRGWPGGGGGGAVGGLMPGEPNGFEDRTNAVLAWDNGTRTLTLTGPANVWAEGRRLQIETLEFQIADVEGLHFIYLDTDGELHDRPAFDISLVRGKAFVTLIYWDATNGLAIPHPFNETHGATMDGVTHEYLHDVNGTVYRDGMQPTVTNIGGNGNSDDDISFSVTAGRMWDEDIPHDLLANAVDDNIPVLYRDGADGLWRMDVSTPFPGIKGTDRLNWNEDTGTTWQLTESSSNDFVLAHLFAFPGLNYDSGQFVIIMGQAPYLTSNAARIGAATEIANLSLGSMPGQEFVPVATFILQTATNYSNTLAAKIVATDTGDDFVDFR